MTNRKLKQEIDTPALLIDLDLMEENLETLARFFRGKHGKDFRPQYKTPKSPFLAAKIGEKLELYPSHHDTTIHLYEIYYGIRDGKVEVIWPISARGKSQ